MKKFKQILTSLLLVMLVVCTVFPSNVNAASSKPKKSKVTVKATLLKDETVLLKVSNKNSQTIALDIKLVYKNGKTVIGEGITGVYGLKGKTTVYNSESFTYIQMKDDLKPTSVQVKFSLRNNYFKPQLKSIKNVVTAKITSTEFDDLMKYQTLHVDIKNISKKDIYGSVTILFYSGKKLVGSRNCILSINKGETSFEEFSPFIFSDEEIHVDSIKLVQNDLRYKK